jgi:DNA replication protein DnaD
MNDGYIKLYKKLFKWQWYKDSNTLHVFITLLLDANYDDSKVGFEIIKRGQVLTSIKRLQELTGLSTQQIRTSLKKLEKSQEINKQITNKYSIITIKNYDNYQIVNKQVTINQQSSNNIKEIYSSNNYIFNNINKNIKEEINKEESLSNQHKTILDLLQGSGYIYFNTPNEFNAVDYLSRVDIGVVKDALEIARIKNKRDLNYILGIVLNKLKQEKNKKKDMDLPEWFDKEYQREELLNDDERRILEEIENSTNKS